MDLFTTLVMALLALASPLAIAWQKNRSWNHVVKAGIPVLVAAVLALVYLVLTDGFNGIDPLAAFLAFYGLQQIAYNLILHGPSKWVEHNTGPNQGVSASTAHRNTSP